ncbi:MAG: hypothetical protein RIC14_05575 [Filomicrobium sp.]
MAYINDAAFDAALSHIETNGTHLSICSSEPANYGAIAAAELGEKASISYTGPANGDTSGRKITIDAITDGNVTANGTATHYAIHDNSSTLLASGALTASQVVTSGNTFTLAAFDIEIADAT